MDQKDKKSDFSIKLTFESWLDIEGQDKVGFILSNTAVGKSTVCHLIKKFIDKDPHPNLKLVEKKKDWEYECEGEINPKTIKPLTIYPKKYEIKSQKMCLIEVPSRIYTLQKKRPNLDRILNTVGLSYSAFQGYFIFAIDSKNTFGKIQPWKKTFQMIFDSFNLSLLNEQTFQSAGFVVINKVATKGAEQLGKDVYLNRMDGLEDSCKDEKRKDQYLRLLKTIYNEKNLSVFKKITQNQDIVSKDIEEIFSMVKKLSKKSIPLQKKLNEPNVMITMEPVMLDKEESILFDKFNDILSIIFDFFSKFFEAIFHEDPEANILNFIVSQNTSSQNSPKKVQKNIHYLKKIWPTDSNLELKTPKIVKIKLNELRKISSHNKNFYQHPLGKASLMIQYKKRIQQKCEAPNSILSTFLQILAEHGLIEQTCPQIPELESLYLQLIQYSIFQERFGPFIKNINYKEMLIQMEVTKQFRELHQLSVKARIHQDFLEKKFSLKVTSQEARKYLQIIEIFFTKDESSKEYGNSIPLLKRRLILLTFDRSDPKKAINQIDILLRKIIDEDKTHEKIKKNKDNPSEQTKQQIEFLNDLALQVAKTLQDYGRPDLCAQIFQDCGNFHSAIQCYKIKLYSTNTSTQSKQVLEETKQIINSYLDLLADMGLYEKALEQCYHLAQLYKSLIPELNEKRKQIKKQRLKSDDQEKEKRFQQRFLNNSSQLSSFYTNKYALEKIKEIAEKNRK